MGSETTKALAARRREASARAVRLIAEAEEHSPIGAARRARIISTVREGRRSVKALGAAERALTVLQARVGAALIRLTEDGLSRSDAYELLDLSRAVGRRLIDVSASTQCASEVPSTSSPIDPAPGAARAEGETGALNCATTKGIL